jgi:hypothetical protein
MVSTPQELVWLNEYLTKAEQDERLKAQDLLSCCSWVLPMNEIIDRAAKGATSEKIRQEVLSLKDEDTYFDDLTDETVRNLILDQVDVQDNEIYYALSNADPAEIPTWFYMSSGDLLEGWLVHFSEHASSIAHQGFRYGFGDMSKLGLTTYFREGGFEKGEPGYNFAFQTEDVRRYAYDRGRPKYGKNAVIFLCALPACTTLH